MVKEDHLCVVGALNDLARSEIAGLRLLRVNINHLAISFISEEQAILSVSLHTEVRRVRHETHLHVPIVEAQIGTFGANLALVHEDCAEIFSLHPMSQIDVGRLFVFAGFLHPNEQDSRRATIAQ